VRRGEDVVAPEREVRCDAIEILAIEPGSITLRIACAKGFYVRSLGRDLARALGTRGHLTTLRRTRSGALASGLDGEVLRRARDDEAARAEVRAALVPLTSALGAMERVVVDAAGARDVRHGKRVAVARPARTEPLAVLDPGGELVAIARWREGVLEVLRGMRAKETR
jgi:tRNA pseudouridine55 synthase